MIYAAYMVYEAYTPVVNTNHGVEHTLVYLVYAGLQNTPLDPHGSTRFTAVAFTIRDANNISPDDCRLLRDLGFRL